MKQLYDFLMNPKATVQLHSHQKNWKAWWLVLSIGGFLSMVKWSSISISSFVSATLINIIVLIILATIIDSSAQFLGQSGKLTTIVYWLGFNQSVLWLLPSLNIIQNTMITFGSLLVFLLNIIYISYLWVTLKQVYKQSTKMMLAIIFCPIIMGVIAIVSSIIWLTKQAGVVV